MTEIVEKHDELGDAKPTKLSAKWVVIIVLVAVLATTGMLGLILLVAKFTKSRRRHGD